MILSMNYVRICCFLYPGGVLSSFGREDLQNSEGSGRKAETKGAEQLESIRRADPSPR